MIFSTQKPQPHRFGRGEGIRPPNAITGWPLLLCGLLEEDHPGFLWSLTKAPSVRRQAIFAAFAFGVLDDPTKLLSGLGLSNDPSGVSLANALLREDSQSITSHLFHGADGLHAALRSIGPDALPTARHYQALAAIYQSRSEDDVARRKVIRQGGRKLDGDLLDAILTIEPKFLFPKLLERVDNLPVAKQFNALATLIQRHCSGATNHALRQSFSQLGETRTLDQWARGWLGKADRYPSPPVTGDSDFMPIPPVRMASVGRQFRNCLSTKVGYVLSGQMAFYEVQTLKAIAVLVRMEDGWTLTRVHGWANGPVGDGVVASVRMKARRHGVRVLAPSLPDSGAGTLFDQWGVGIADLEDFNDA